MESRRQDLDRLENLVVALEGMALDVTRHRLAQHERGQLARLEPEREPRPVQRPEPNPL